MKRIFHLLVHRIAPAVIIVAGLFVAAYPWISDYVYKDRVSGLISEYQEAVENTDEKELAALRKNAEEYNERLRNDVQLLHDPFDGNAVVTVSRRYSSMLTLKNTQLLGVITIPKIGVELPIYRGTSAQVLESGIGHMEGTSIPVGGEGTHSALTGHTGLSDKKLFTDLDRLVKGDLFFLDVLGEKMCYRVCDINVVLPSDISKLSIDDEKDLCTLITCTPYGINSHRLLVCGKRCAYKSGMENIKKGSYVSDWRREYFLCIFIGVMCAAILIVVILLFRRKRRKKNER